MTTKITLSPTKKTNLFFKEPEWLDEKKSVDRIKDIRFVDSNGRNAWHQSLTSVVNSSGLRLEVDRKQERVVFLRNDVSVGQWTFDVLGKRLQEKHSEAVFVAAATRGQGRDDEF